MSAELQWELIKNRSCYLVKRKALKGVTFTREPMNLTGINSFKFNGLVNQKAVGVFPTKDKKGVLLQIRRKGKSRKPSKMYSQMKLTNTNRKIYRSIRKFLGNQQYRPDLVEHAVRRASAILKKQKPNKRMQAAAAAAAAAKK